MIVFALLDTPPLHAQTAAHDTAGVEAAVRAFHEALRAGDAAAVERMLASDALILEGGQRETRAEYLSHHLQADIEFARAVPSRTRKLEARVIGDVAWVTSTSVSEGTFRDRPIKLAGAELIVLARRGTAWEIRAIHWSSRQAK